VPLPQPYIPRLPAGRLLVNNIGRQRFRIVDVRLPCCGGGWSGVLLPCRLPHLPPRLLPPPPLLLLLLLLHMLLNQW